MTGTEHAARQGGIENLLTGLASDANIVRRQGTVWIFQYADHVTLHRDCKGVRLVAHLLLHPHERIPASVVEAASEGHARCRPRGSAGEILTRETLDSYRGRWDDLREGLDEARRNGDPHKAELIQQEIGFLAQQVSQGVGQHGRLRRAADETDRARLRTTMAITRFLKVLKPHHPALWRHLSMSIQTGNSLAYVPERPTLWAT